VSLIKTEKITKTKLFYDPNDTLILNGLSANSPVETVDSIILTPRIHDYSLKMKFHIVRDNANVPFDGLLGNAF
jgi:hypothetical protein